MGRLQDKIALVTGAARFPSTGRTIALRLAREGAHVVVNGRDRSPDTFTELERQKDWSGLDSVKKEIEVLGVQSMAVVADVTSEEQVLAMFDEVVNHFGGVDILVNNAAETPLAPFLEMDEVRWDLCMDVNVIGPFLCGREAAKRMAKNGRGGRIINVSSQVGIVGAPTASAYAASKAALNNLTQVMALEWGADKINVNAVCPGVMTDSGNHRVGNYFPVASESEHWETMRAIIQSQKESSPLGTLDDPESLASLVVFLASADADKITGQALNLTSGLLM